MNKEEEKISDIEEEGEATLRGFTLFFVGVVLLLSISSLIFYSTIRARSIGITNGYIKAIELNYQAGSYRPLKDTSEEEFDTGIYKVYIKTTHPKEETGIVVKVSIKDKYFAFTHYSEELKLIPVADLEPEDTK